MKEECMKKAKDITEKFKACRKAFSALGDETRQLIIIALLESDYRGIRVGEISKKTHLSRPAVSHHLQILKDAEIINMRREGTKNYYYINPSESIWDLIYELVKEVNIGVKHLAKENLGEEI